MLPPPPPPPLLRPQPRCGNFLPHVGHLPLGAFSAAARRGSNPPPPGRSPDVTFDNVAEDGGSEVLPRALVEVLPVDDPHLFEESGLAALARAEQQDLHQPLHVRLLPGQAPVDLLGPAELLHLAAVEQAHGQENFEHGPGRQEIRHVRTNFIDADLMRVRGARARDQAPSLNSGSGAADTLSSDTFNVNLFKLTRNFTSFFIFTLATCFFTQQTKRELTWKCQIKVCIFNLYRSVTQFTTKTRNYIDI